MSSKKSLGPFVGLLAVQAVANGAKFHDNCNDPTLHQSDGHYYLQADCKHNNTNEVQNIKMAHCIGASGGDLQSENEYGHPLPLTRWRKIRTVDSD